MPEIKITPGPADERFSHLRYSHNDDMDGFAFRMDIIKAALNSLQPHQKPAFLEVGEGSARRPITRVDLYVENKHE